MLKFSWIITLVATCFASLGLCFGLAASNGAPQQAAVAAIAAAAVIIPYVFTRAIEGLKSRDEPTPAVWSSPTVDRNPSELAAQQQGNADRDQPRIEPSVSRTGR